MKRFFFATLLLLNTNCATLERKAAPVSPEAAGFNEGAYNLGLPVRWHDDGDGVIEEGELAGLESFPRAKFEGGRPNDFLEKLIEKIRWMTAHRTAFIEMLKEIPRLDLEVQRAQNREDRRRALRNRDLATRGNVEVEVDFSPLSAADQKAIRILLDNAVPAIEAIYFAQMDPKNLSRRDEIILRGDPEDLFAFYNMGGAACLTDGIDPLCSPHPDSPTPTPNQGLWPDDFDEGDFKDLLEGGTVETPNLEDLKSSFVYRRNRRGGPLTWKNLNTYPPIQRDQQRLVSALREAASTSGANRSVARFMKLRAEELTDTQKSFPFFDGDIAWIDTKGSWDLTVGYYEEYHSPFHSTAIMEGFIGVVDQSHEKQGEAFQNLLAWMEEDIARELGPAYHRRDFRTLPPLKFQNAVSIGDGRAKYIPAAFYLPNIPPHGRSELSKKVFLLNNSRARFEGVTLPMAELTMDRQQTRRLRENSSDLDLFVIGHENAHGAGPGGAYVIRSEGGQKITVDNLLREHSKPLEEARADMVGLASLPEAVRRGIITREQAENAAIGLVASLLRGLVLGVEDSHGKGAFVEFTTLFEKGAIAETPEGRYTVNLEKIFDAAREIGQRMNRIQLTGNYDEFDRWYLHSIEGLPKRMKEKYLPLLKKMPKDFFPYYRFKFSS